RDVQVIRWLVEHKDILLRVDQLRKREAAFLAAGEGANTFLYVFAKEKEPGEKPAKLNILHRRGDTTHLADHVVPFVQVIEALRVVADIRFRAPAHASLKGRDLAKQRF